MSHLFLTSSCLSSLYQSLYITLSTYIFPPRVLTPSHGLGHAFAYHFYGFDPGLIRNTHRIPYFTIIGLHELLYYYLNCTCMLVYLEHFLDRASSTATNSC
ncbi:uncharacterized protein SCHCODRAFT_02088501 [Schizophyllum commune H4-8]|uniref:uncharacterized protein n=1 Tax=Schizophyllum commune (strain H4-8 / FGSC 9210) TaxID=578458 RepID=UPI0021602F94|nr:uncharacterized protein SCHCODRAFT_02088501 [Schizophyllum commune H4-8]KAI5887094.1 hypothetical protein SCHCODRAFT_02088501 [Schizophyllum commune H4-8]